MEHSSLKKIILSFICISMFGIVFGQSSTVKQFSDTTHWYYLGIQDSYQPSVYVAGQREVERRSYRKDAYLNSTSLWTFIEKDKKIYIYNRALGPNRPLKLKSIKVETFSLLQIVPLINLFYHPTKTEYLLEGSVFAENKGISHKIYNKYVKPYAFCFGTEEELKDELNTIKKNKKDLGVSFSDINKNGEIIHEGSTWYNLIAIPEGKNTEYYLTENARIMCDISKDSILCHLNDKYLWAFIETPIGISLYNKATNKIEFENLRPIKDGNQYSFINLNDQYLGIKAAEYFGCREMSSHIKYSFQKAGTEQWIENEKKIFKQKEDEKKKAAIEKARVKSKELAEKYLVGSIYSTKEPNVRTETSPTGMRYILKDNYKIIFNTDSSFVMNTITDFYQNGILVDRRSSNNITFYYLVTPNKIIISLSDDGDFKMDQVGIPIKNNYKELDFDGIMLYRE